MKRRDLNEKLGQADAAGAWAFTLPSFSVLMGGIDPAYLKLRMKRLSDQGVLVRALGVSAIAVRAAIDAAWAEARQALLGAPLPPRRK